MELDMSMSGIRTDGVNGSDFQNVRQPRFPNVVSRTQDAQLTKSHLAFMKLRVDPAHLTDDVFLFLLGGPNCGRDRDSRARTASYHQQTIFSLLEDAAIYYGGVAGSGDNPRRLCYGSIRQ